jgi:hypothetical protein
VHPRANMASDRGAAAGARGGTAPLPPADVGRLTAGGPTTPLAPGRNPIGGQSS